MVTQCYEKRNFIMLHTVTHSVHHFEGKESSLAKQRIIFLTKS